MNIAFEKKCSALFALLHFGGGKCKSAESAKQKNDVAEMAEMAEKRENYATYAIYASANFYKSGMVWRAMDDVRRNEGYFTSCPCKV